MSRRVMVLGVGAFAHAVMAILKDSGAETGCYDLAHFLAEQDCKSYIMTSGGELLLSLIHI